MKVNKSPAFQFYPSDFLADGNTMLMSTEEIGAYTLLMCVCWNENELPGDIEDLASLARMEVKRFTKSWEKRISKCFMPSENGGWMHPRLEQEREKQSEYRKERSEAGKRGAQKRWSDSAISDGSAIAQPLPSNGSAMQQPMANDSSSSSSSSSSSVLDFLDSETERPARPEGDAGHPADASPPAHVYLNSMELSDFEHMARWRDHEVDRVKQVAQLFGEMYLHRFKQPHHPIKRESWEIATAKLRATIMSGVVEVVEWADVIDQYLTEWNGESPTTGEKRNPNFEAFCGPRMITNLINHLSEER